MSRLGLAFAVLRAGGRLIGTGEPAPMVLLGSNPAVLALHGFGSTPQEVALVVEASRSVGLRALAPLLPGHGTHARDLARTRYADWYAAAEREFNTLSQTGPVVVAGLSLGAIIALDLTAQHPQQVAGVIALANALRLASPYPARFLAAHERWGLPNIYVPKWAGPDIGDPVARERHLGYASQPITPAVDLWHAGRRVLGTLSRITCPALIAHGQHDRVCPVSNAWLVANRLGTRDAQVVVLPNSHHIVTEDADRDLLLGHLEGFLKERVG